MSKAELARKAGISTLTIDRVEKGKSCRLETKRKIILALGLELSDRGKIFGNGWTLFPRYRPYGPTPKKCFGYQALEKDRQDREGRKANHEKNDVLVIDGPPIDAIRVLYHPR